MRQLKFCVVATFLTFGLCLGVGCKGLWNNDDDVSTTTSGTSSNSSSDSSSDSSTDANAYSTEQDSDYDFSTNTDSITYIHCLGSSFNIEGRVDAVDVKSSNLKCEILYGGTYYIDGTLNDGQIQVEADTSEIVKILLNGVTISGSTYQAQAPLRIKSCKKAILMIADGTTNTITEMSGNEDSACVFSKADLYICDQGASTGTLTVESVASIYASLR